MKVEELTDKIEELSGLELDVLPRMTGFSWFPHAKTGEPITIVLGQAFPLKEGLTAYAMFQNDDVVRVYTLSKSADKPSPPTRYTFTKAAPTYAAEVMSLDTFIDEIAEEWQEVAGLDDIDLTQDDDEIDEPIAHEVVGQTITAENNATPSATLP